MIGRRPPPQSQPPAPPTPARLVPFLPPRAGEPESASFRDCSGEYRLPRETAAGRAFCWPGNAYDRNSFLYSRIFLGALRARWSASKQGVSVETNLSERRSRGPSHGRRPCIFSHHLLSGAWQALPFALPLAPASAAAGDPPARRPRSMTTGPASSARPAAGASGQNGARSRPRPGAAAPSGGGQPNEPERRAKTGVLACGHRNDLIRFPRRLHLRGARPPPANPGAQTKRRKLGLSALGISRPFQAVTLRTAARSFPTEPNEPEKARPNNGVACGYPSVAVVAQPGDPVAAGPARRAADPDQVAAMMAAIVGKTGGVDHPLPRRRAPAHRDGARRARHRTSRGRPWPSVRRLEVPSRGTPGGPGARGSAGCSRQARERPHRPRPGRHHPRSYAGGDAACAR